MSTLFLLSLIWIVAQNLWKVKKKKKIKIFSYLFFLNKNGLENAKDNVLIIDFLGNNFYECKANSGGGGAIYIGLFFFHFYF